MIKVIIFVHPLPNILAEGQQEHPAQKNEQDVLHNFIGGPR
jgi:hypothetical protein